MSDTTARLTGEQLARIAAADAAREPGEWRVIPAHWSPDGHWSDLLCDVPGIEGLVIGEMQNHRNTDVPHQFLMSDANAQFVALCSWAVPALLREVAALTAERDAARAAKQPERKVRPIPDIEEE